MASMADIVRQKLYKNLLIILGWFFILLGAIGILLPIFPTTPFLILALALFANSSPRFHQMLLDNRWFGNVLKQWSETKTVTRQVKFRASALILVSFSISIAVLQGRLLLQAFLVTIAVILLIFVWQLEE